MALLLRSVGLGGGGRGGGGLECSVVGGFGVEAFLDCCASGIGVRSVDLGLVMWKG